MFTPRMAAELKYLWFRPKCKDGCLRWHAQTNRNALPQSAADIHPLFGTAGIGFQLVPAANILPMFHGYKK